jgi:predicted O-methyltransferase YrrM
MTAGCSSIPEVQALLRVLAAGRHRAGEVGAAFGEGSVAIAEGLPPGATLVTVELDPERAEVARKALAPFSNVRLLEGDWRGLQQYGPFDLLFVDVHEAKTDPAVLELIEPGGLVMIDDMTPTGVRPGRATARRARYARRRWPTRMGRGRTRPNPRLLAPQSTHRRSRDPHPPGHGRDPGDEAQLSARITSKKSSKRSNSASRSSR